MLHIENEFIKKHILDGNFGLEKESLRIFEDGTFAHRLHPFPKDRHIVKDFCENQTEINTSVHASIEETLEELEFHNQRICQKLWSLPEKEYLWPFSNPPYIENERDIPVAVFEGREVSKTAYRDYLSHKYGRYKMTFSGIHVNFSFSEELLRADFTEEQKRARTGGKKKPLENESDYLEYKNSLYLRLAEQMAACGWILVAVTAASPILDSSFLEKGVYDRDIFTGMASVRCSEMGYWNEFAPIFDYSSVKAYADSIQKYVDNVLLKAPSELYYPIRLKPRGENSLEVLRRHGVDHIELRMFDLNPLVEAGVEAKDIRFAQLLMVWLASAPTVPLTQRDQIQAVQNFKNAAHYDLKTVGILNQDNDSMSAAEAALAIIRRMKEFYGKIGLPVQEILEFEYEKFADARNRYAWKIREQFKDGYVNKTLELIKERQEK